MGITETLTGLSSQVFGEDGVFGAIVTLFENLATAVANLF